jgi:hypothetical protein
VEVKEASVRRFSLPVNEPCAELVNIVVIVKTINSTLGQTAIATQEKDTKQLLQGTKLCPVSVHININTVFTAGTPHK